MGINKFNIILSIIFFIVCIFLFSCSAYSNDGIIQKSNQIKFLVKNSISIIIYDLKKLTGKTVYALKVIYNKIFSSINNFANLLNSEKQKDSNKRNKNTELDIKIRELKDYAKNYDEIVLNTMLLYSTSGIPSNKDLIINIYTVDESKKLNLEKFIKYHFKIQMIKNDEYEKLKKQKYNEIEKNSNLINNKDKQIKENNEKRDQKTEKKLYVTKYKLSLKGSKPVIIAMLMDDDGIYYYSLIENFSGEITNLKDDFKLFYKGSYPKIQYHSFYYYPLSQSLMEVVVGFYYPISPMKFFSFFAIIFIIVILLLVFGYLLLKQYLFDEYKGENIKFKDKKIENNFTDETKKMEKIEKVNNNIIEKDKNKEGYQEEKKEEKNVVGKPINIDDIPDFKDF